MLARNAKRLVFALGLALLLPGMAVAGGSSVDPNGGLNGGMACMAGDCHATIDPNG